MDEFTSKPTGEFDDTPQEPTAPTTIEPPVQETDDQYRPAQDQTTPEQDEAPSSPYENSPYVSHREAQDAGATQQWQTTFQAEPYVHEAPAKKQKKAKKSHGTGKVVAAILACTLVGGTLGGIVTGYLVNDKWEDSTAQLQAQIDKMGGKNSSGITVQTVPTSDVPASASGLLTPAQVYEQNVSSVVSVITEGMTSNGWGMTPFKGSGSGFIITEDGYVLTNYHVIEGSSTVTVTTKDGVDYPAVVVGSDSLNDVALLKVEATGLPSVVIGDSDSAAVGDMVAAIGNPLGELDSTQTVGYISAKNRKVNTDGTVLNMLQTDAAINSGNSGGPLFNMYGQVIGITTAKYSGSSNSGASIEGIGFAIPINAVMDLVDDLMEFGYITNQAYLGVNVQELNAQVAEAYGLPSGPRVASVTEGSCAQKAGVQEGDIIIRLGDTDIASRSELTYALREHSAGETSTITVFRAGAEVTMEITFDEKPATPSSVPGEAPTEAPALIPDSNP